MCFSLKVCVPKYLKIRKEKCLNFTKGKFSTMEKSMYNEKVVYKKAIFSVLQAGFFFF